MASLQPLLNALGSLVLQAPPLRLRRDGRDPFHLVADPPLTRAAAIEWLWRGRVQPPAERFKADPVQDPPDGPQRRFLFLVTPDEFVEARQDFKDQYLKDGPGITLERQLKAIIWLPDAIRQQLLDMDSRGELIRSDRTPVVKTFPGHAPWGNIVAWAGPYEFRGWNTVEIFQYFPADKQFYIDLVEDEWRGGLLRTGYTTWNADIQYFVEQKHMRPTEAREEMLRIYTNIFKSMMEAFANVIGEMTALSMTYATMKKTADDVAGSVLASYRAHRRAFGLATRRSLPVLTIYRGTTLRLRRGDPNMPPDLHDLGMGCYFTDDPAVAAQYAGMRGTADDPAIVLQATVSKADLGRVLDLVDGPLAQRWNQVVKQASGGGKLANERYNKLFRGFLEENGLSLDDFDTVIGQEFLRPSIQYNIRNGTVLDRILLQASESWHF